MPETSARQQLRPAVVDIAPEVHRAIAIAIASGLIHRTWVTGWMVRPESFTDEIRTLVTPCSDPSDENRRYPSDSSDTY